MTYKSYTARVKFSAEDKCFIGHIAGIQDVVGFHADTMVGLKLAFYESVDDYLKTCTSIDKAPDTLRDHYDFSHSVPNPMLVG